jgi:DNA-binding LacI/PurR family transcriptional regulator/AraC-like DNA-binding protein
MNRNRNRLGFSFDAASARDVSPERTCPADHVPRETKKCVFTVGLLINHIDDSFQTDVFNGVAGFAEHHNCNLICFIGGELNSPNENRTYQNAVYRLAGVYNVDGIIGLSNSLFSYVSKDRMIGFYNAYFPLPAVSIGIDLGDTPCVRIDNQGGLRDLLTHLIEVHRVDDIAFIAGPDHNVDARSRLDTYREVLTAYSIPLRENLIVPGTFTKASGAKAVWTLFDVRRESCRAIVAANDHMAIGALRELQARGIRVPEDVMVVGFDDIPECLAMKPALTTVRQPDEKLGYRAAEILYERLQSRESKERVKTVFPTELVIRQSCGCRGERAAGMNATGGTARVEGRAGDGASWSGEQFHTLLEIAEALLVISDWEKLKTLLQAYLPQLGVRSFYLSLFEDRQGCPPQCFSNMHVAIENNKIIETVKNDTRYLTGELIPGGLKGGRRKTYLTMNLYSRFKQLGFVMYDVEQASVSLLEKLTMEINNMINRMDFEQGRFLLPSAGNSGCVGKNQNLEKYGKSKPQSGRSIEYYKKIVFLMEKKKLFLRPDMSIGLLSKITRIPQHNISYIINTYADMNFYRFLNRYRIKAVLALLRENPQKKVIDIAFEAGFKAKSTFNKFFKDYTRVSPSEYVKMQGDVRPTFSEHADAGPGERRGDRPVRTRKKSKTLKARENAGETTVRRRKNHGAEPSVV